MKIPREGNKDLPLRCNRVRDFPAGPLVKNLPSNAGDMGLIPGWGIRSHMSLGNKAGVPELERTLCAAMKAPARCN